jgi:MYXO-CTERM domain-containing protein
VGRAGYTLTSHRTYLLGLATSIALGCAVAVAALPGSAVRPGGVERGDARSVLFIAALALAFGFYVVALLGLRRAGRRLAVVCAIAAAIQLIPLAGPLLLSRDVYSYWAYARIAWQHDRDPYVSSPATFPGDPATRVVARGWRHTTSVYGPAFTAASIAVDDTAASPESVAFTFRALAALAAIGAALLAAQIAWRKTFAAAFVGWNPLLAVAFAGGGHNDALMLVLILAALALARRRRDVASGAAWILAGAVKAPALFLLPLQLVHAPRRLWLGGALASLAGSIAATVAFGSSWLTALLHLENHESRYALPSRLEQAGLPDHLVHPLALTALVAGGVWLARQSLRGRARMALGFCLLIVTSPWLLPWYATWPVALAAVEEDAAAQVLALALAAYLLPSRVPF